MSMLNDSGPSVQLNNVNASQHVHVFGVHLSLDLSLDKHVSSVSTTCFNHLRQLRCIRRLLDADSVSTLVHAFMTSYVDCCNAVLAVALKTTTNRLQRVLNAAVRVVSDTKKFHQGLSRLMHQELHWLDIPERVNYKAPVYLSNCCIPVSQVTAASMLRCTSSADRTSTSSQHLRSAGICCRWSDDV